MFYSHWDFLNQLFFVNIKHRVVFPFPKIMDTDTHNFNKKKKHIEMLNFTFIILLEYRSLKLLG